MTDMLLFKGQRSFKHAGDQNKMDTVASKFLYFSPKMILNDENSFQISFVVAFHFNMVFQNMLH